MQLDPLFQSHIASNLTQSFSIGITHVREARAQFRVVRPSQGVVTEKVDMIPDKHDIAALEIWVHPTAGIAYKECMRTILFQYPDWKCDLLHGVAFIKMKAPLHSHHLFASQHAEQQPAGMTFHSGDWEVGDLVVGKRCVNVHFIVELPKACAQNQQVIGSGVCMMTDIVKLLISFLNEF